MENNNYLYCTSDIIKSSVDTNEYKFVVLKNRLKMLLVSDSDADQSGCSLCVNVGSFDEPFGVNGLAHFLEHLLFMGTEKYPDENDYMAYLNMHNGSSNAYTSNETTVFYFDVSNKYFEGALDRFAHFFISSLFKENSVEREKSAVNSEFLGNVSNDDSRRNRLLQLCYQNHLEESRFSIGNNETLKFEDIRKRVIDFYKNTYFGDRMVAVVYCNKSMDDIEKLIEVFNNVPCSSAAANTEVMINSPCKLYNEYIENVMKSNWYNSYSNYTLDSKVFKQECLNKLLRLKSIRDVKRLDIYIKTLHPYISKIAFDVLIKDLLKEDKGLIKLLKDQGLGYDVNVSISSVKYYGLLNISVFLTSRGFFNPDLVVEEIEKYFLNYKILSSKLKGLVDQNEINFEFNEQEDVIDVLEVIADNLSKIPVKNILNFEHLQTLPKEEVICCLLNLIKNRSEWITIFSSSEFECKEKDEIFGIEYEM